MHLGLGLGLEAVTRAEGQLVHAYARAAGQRAEEQRQPLLRALTVVSGKE